MTRPGLLFAILFVGLLGGCASVRWPSLPWINSVASSNPGAPKIETATLIKKSTQQQPLFKKSLPAPKLDYTPEVEQQILRFTRRDPHFITAALDRSDGFRKKIALELKREGVPEELLNLAMIESGFNQHARSGAGAVGIWQFMKGTAQVYGLEVNLFSDQRKDLVESSAAAARHLRDLYTAYESWHLALAAYNCGTARVDRAIRQAGTKDFWTLSRKGLFPPQTREFVPRFIAVTLLVKEPERFQYAELLERNLAKSNV